MLVEIVWPFNAPNLLPAEAAFVEGGHLTLIDQEGVIGETVINEAGRTKRKLVET